MHISIRVLIVSFTISGFISTTCIAQQIITDGKTSTSLINNGNITDISTSTIKGNNAFNSFSKFNVENDNIVNLKLPANANNLINLIHDEASIINGTLNSIKNNQIGGNLLLVNPHGITVGPQGSINVGSLTAITPTKDFTDNFFDASGSPSDASIDALLDGTVPLNKDATINVQGTINAIETVKLETGNIDISGNIYSGSEGYDNIVQLSDVLNIETTSDASDISIQNGEIVLNAEGNIAITGAIVSDGINNIDAGNITLTAKDNIIIEKQSLISAKGQGENSNAGDIYIYAQNKTTFKDGSVIDARGGNISGDGGFIELSAKNTVETDGGYFLANANNGTPGEVLIDPIWVNVGDQLTDGVNINIVAVDSIIVNPNVIVSSRNLVTAATGENVAAADHLNDPSMGNSGNIVFDAPLIEINDGAKILAFADGGFTSGNISFINNDETRIFNNTFINGLNISINPNNLLNVYGGDIVAQADLSIDNGDLLNFGMTFTPNSIETGTITSGFIVTGASMLLNSNQPISLGNTDKIVISGTPFQPTDIFLSSPLDVTISGSCSTATGFISINSTGGNAIIDNNSFIRSADDINVSANGANAIIKQGAILEAFDLITVNGFNVQIETGTIFNAPSNDIDIIPNGLGKLEVMGGRFYTVNDIEFGSGDILNNGITFKPEAIDAISLTSSFIADGAATAINSNSRIEFGNTDHIYVNMNQLDQTNITLSSTNDNVVLSGYISPSTGGDFTATGNDIIIKPDTRIIANNINLSYDDAAIGSNITLLEGTFIASNQFQINSSGAAISNKSITFVPESIFALSFNSNFLPLPNNPLNLNGNYPIHIGNLDNIVINSNPYEPSSITIASTIQAEFSGDISTTGNFSAVAPEIIFNLGTTLLAANITIDPSNYLNLDKTSLSSAGTLFIDRGDVNTYGITFSPERIGTNAIAGDLLTVNSPFTLLSTTDISIGNLDNIIIGGNPLNPTSVTLTSTGGEVAVSGNITTSGNISINPNTRLVLESATLTTDGQITLNSGDILNYGIVFNPRLISASTLVSDFLTLGADFIINSNTNAKLGNINNIIIGATTYDPTNIIITGNIVELTGGFITLGDMSVNPSLKLELIDAEIDVTGTLNLNGGNIALSGIDFIPAFINAGSMTSDFIPSGGELNLRSFENISIGNLSSIIIGGSALNLTNINITVPEDKMIEIQGGFDAISNIRLNGGFINVADGASLNATNVQIDPRKSLEFNQADVFASTISLNGGYIPGYGFTLNPNTIDVTTFSSDFITDGSIFTISANNSIHFGNIDNIFISSVPINLTSVDITTYTGDITLTGSITTGLVDIDAREKLIVDNATINGSSIDIYCRGLNKFGIHFNPSSITSTSTYVSDFMAIGANLVWTTYGDITLGNTTNVFGNSSFWNPGQVNLTANYGDITLLNNITAVSGSMFAGAGKRLIVDNATINVPTSAMILQLISPNFDIWGVHFDPNSINCENFNSNFLPNTTGNPINIFSKRDIVFGGTDVFTINVAPYNPTDITLNSRGSIFVTDDALAAGDFTVSSMLGDLIIDDLQATGTALMNAETGSVIDYNNDSLRNIWVNSLDINAFSVGDSSNALDIEVMLANNLNVTAIGNIVLNNTNGDMSITLIESKRGDVILETQGATDIVDGANDANANIIGDNIYLVGDQVGELIDALELNSTGCVDIQADTLVNIREVAGDLSIGLIETTGILGDVTIENTVGNIFDIFNDLNPNIITRRLTFNALTIGSPLDDLDIDLSLAGRLYVQANGDIYIRETNGNMVIDQVTAIASHINLTT
ncbi:MAG: leukotoxin LktA family filamentous adhesin, partial [Cyanobacteriota bacterium]